ncbi:MAG: hypothetical protein Q7J47_03350 [Azoarcus sp.]|nr:hypothetical protein [Azoarcus sp.]
MATLPVPTPARILTVHEITVQQVRDWAVSIDTGLVPLDPVGELLHPECALADLVLMSDATPAEIEQCTSAQLDHLVATAKALNPHFFRVRAALQGVARQISQSISSAPAPTSSAAVTPTSGPTPTPST